MARQFVVQLKNEPGAMATLAEALAARGVDLRAIGGGSMGDSGHVIMTTADDDDGQGRPRRARATPTSRANRSWPRSTTARAGWPGWRASWPTPSVNIYGHLFLGRWGDRATFAFVVDKPDVGPPDPRAQGLTEPLDRVREPISADLGYAARLRARWALRSAPRSITVSTPTTPTP